MIKNLLRLAPGCQITTLINSGVILPPWNTVSTLFDGIDDYALSATMPASIPQNPTSISWWQKRVSTAGLYDGYIWTGPTSAPAAWPGALDQKFGTWSRVPWTTYELNTGNGTGLPGAGGSATISSGAWQHWCITDSSTSGGPGTAKAYVDGVEVITGASLVWASTDTYTLYLGRWGVYVGDYANVYMDEVSVWGYELTPSQVVNLYNFGTPTDPSCTTGISVAPLHFWRMGEFISGTTIPDQIGSSDITLVNGPTTSPDVP